MILKAFSVVELSNLIYRGDAGLHFCIQVNLTLLNQTRRVPKLSETWGPLKWPRIALFKKKTTFFRILPQRICLMSGTSVVEGLECWASRSGGSGFESLSCQTSKCDGALNPPVILGYHWLVQSLTAGWVFCMCAVQYQHKILKANLIREQNSWIQTDRQSDRQTNSTTDR